MMTILKVKNVFLIIAFLLINICFFQADAQNNDIFNSENGIKMIQSNSTPPQYLIEESANLLSVGNFSAETKQKTDNNIKSLSITIIESQSINSGHIMDLHWQGVAISMGYTATIVPQTTLDNLNFFSTTDILIVSSGIIDIPTNRRQVIQQWVELGGPLYIQSEYQSTYHANQTFQEIVNNLGGTFAWGSTVTGDLIPMNISGNLSTTPNIIPSLNYFWYGCEGSGNATIEHNMEFDGQYFGFIFTPPNPDHNIIITNSDQDWAFGADEKELLMENILTSFSLTLTDIKSYDLNGFSKHKLNQNYPNPCYNYTHIKYSVSNPGLVSLKIFDLLGKDVATIVSSFKTTGDYVEKFETSNLSDGSYFYQLKIGDEIVDTKKMMIAK